MKAITNIILAMLSGITVAMGLWVMIMAIEGAEVFSRLAWQEFIVLPLIIISLLVSGWRSFP